MHPSDIKGNSIYIATCLLPKKHIQDYLSAAIKMLPHMMQEEINRYHKVKDRMLRVISRLMIAYLIEDYLKKGRDILLNWQKDTFGRPFIKGLPIDISISHSEPWVAVAVALNGRIGIDIEVYRNVDVDIFANYLTWDEIKRIKSSPIPSHEAIKRWSVREAILKADGRGLLVPDDVIRNAKGLLSPCGRPWCIKQILFSKACLYLAHEDPHSSLRLLQLDINELVNPSLITSYHNKAIL